MMIQLKTKIVYWLSEPLEMCLKKLKRMRNKNKMKQKVKINLDESE